MKIIHSLIALLVFGFLLQTNGCFGPGTASFGSRSKVVRSNALKNVSRICVFPVRVRTKGTNEIPPDDSTTTMLWNEIESRHLFTLVPMDTVKSAMRQQGTWDSTTTQRVGRSVGAHAFIWSRMEYSKASFGEAVADLVVQLIDCETDSVIAYGLHNTYLGNSYFWPPGFETVRHDAIKGAVDALAKSIEAANSQ